MAKALARQIISLKNGREEVYAFLRKYQATYYRNSSSARGQVFWSAPINQWLLLMKPPDTDAVQITFHAAADCPCKRI